ncbi:hypothetical protein EYF80_049269 [Liparis tanakae]|uniref:Uncharacterized protein n=1 Tax=Liparis tanakae TaxID=230148 RepID=A0A4Z2FH68_9TELE|nr:hypothetical protein EYF80_049269 [Liparis tanakae]
MGEAGRRKVQRVGKREEEDDEEDEEEEEEDEEEEEVEAAGWRSEGYTNNGVRRVLAMSVETLREGRGLTPCLVSVKTGIISFIHHGITHH